VDRLFQRDCPWNRVAKLIYRPVCQGALDVNEVRNAINETAYSWNLPMIDLGLD